MKNLFHILFFTFLLEKILTKCSIQQNCNVDDPTCLPIGLDEDKFFEPEILTGTDVVCLDYLNKKACCNNGQNKVLTKNFQAVDDIFGFQYGGCDLCAVNLKRFWCEFSCGINQSDYTRGDGYGDFVIDGQKLTLLKVNLTLNKDMNCKLYKSCKKTRYATEVTSMNNAIGFTSFQGTEAHRKIPLYINMLYDDKFGMNITMDDCNLNATEYNHTLHGFNVNSTCTCNTCASACKFENKYVFSPMEGFHLWIVISFYLFVIFVSMIITYCKKSFSKHEELDEEGQSSSIVEDSTKKQNIININEKSDNSQVNKSFEK